MAVPFPVGTVIHSTVMAVPFPVGTVMAVPFLVGTVIHSTVTVFCSNWLYVIQLVFKCQAFSFLVTKSIMDIAMVGCH